jgi:DNA-binding MarR family transcriptional regulator
MDNSTYETAKMARRLGITIVNARNRVMAEYGLTSAQADCMGYIIRHRKEPELTVTDLMRDFSLTHQTAAGLVRRLEEKGLVERRKSGTDARCMDIFPTEKGLCLKDALHQNTRMTQAAMLKGMTESEKAEFLRLLKAAIVNLGGSAE